LEKAVNKDILKKVAQKAAAPGTDKKEEVYTAGMFSLYGPWC
jgi:hypothetical protein